MVNYTKEEIILLKRLNTPGKIQDYLDSMPYDPIKGTSSPRFVMKERKANCFEGALFAAAALEFNGFKPLIVDMTAKNDDDHVIAVFKIDDHYGAVAKSNTTVLRYREPVYKSIRELIMSYFDVYISLTRKKSLRNFSREFSLKSYKEWQTIEKNLDYIGDDLENSKHYSILTDKMQKNLRDADPLLLKATLIGSDPKGLFKPR